MDIVMQRENESARVVVEGRRVDDGTRCTVVAIRELNGCWVFYPHGIGALGARLGRDDAASLARKMLATDPSAR